MIKNRAARKGDNEECIRAWNNLLKHVSINNHGTESPWRRLSKESEPPKLSLGPPLINSQKIILGNVTAIDRRQLVFGKQSLLH